VRANTAIKPTRKRSCDELTVTRPPVEPATRHRGEAWPDGQQGYRWSGGGGHRCCGGVHVRRGRHGRGGGGRIGRLRGGGSRLRAVARSNPPSRRGRVRRPGDPATEVTQVISTEVTQVVPAQRTAGDARVVPPVVPVPSPRRIRLPLLAGATAVIFLVGLLVVTGIELLTGGPVLSSHRESGTSVGRVLGYGFGSSSTTAAPASSMSSATATTASSSPTRSDRSDKGAIPSDSPSAAGSAEPSATSAPDGRITATPTAPSQAGLGASDR
jgi:hypothetical protein